MLLPGLIGARFNWTAARFGLCFVAGSSRVSFKLFYLSCASTATPTWYFSVKFNYCFLSELTVPTCYALNCRAVFKGAGLVPYSLFNTVLVTCSLTWHFFRFKLQVMYSTYYMRVHIIFSSTPSDPEWLGEGLLLRIQNVQFLVPKCHETCHGALSLMKYLFLWNHSWHICIFKLDSVFEFWQAPSRCCEYWRFTSLSASLSLEVSGSAR